MMIENHDTNLVVAGGKGLAMFDGADVLQEWLPETLETPYGRPSGKISLVEWRQGRFFCFSRHGDNQQLSPADIPYLANAYALKALGVKYWVAVSLSTALKGAPQPGDVVVPDDYTSLNVNRQDQFFSAETLPGLVLYIDNYRSSVSPVLKTALKQAADRAGVDLRVNVAGTVDQIADQDLIVFAGVNGPQTGTYAEEKHLKAAFTNVVSGMTNMTEALVAAQAGIGFAALNFIGGQGLNYTSVEQAMAAYLTPGTGGIDARIVPILSHFVNQDLTAPPERSLSKFLGMCTGGKQVFEAINTSEDDHAVDPKLISAVKILAP